MGATGRKILPAILFLAIFAPMAAGNLSLDTTDTEIWVLPEGEYQEINDIVLEGEAECSNETDLRLHYDDVTDDITVENGEFEHRLDTGYYGDYTLSLYCDNDNSTQDSTSFDLRHLSVNGFYYDYSGNAVYHQEEVDIVIDLDYRGDPDLDPGNTDVMAEFYSGNQIEDFEFRQLSDENGELTYRFEIPDVEEEGDDKALITDLVYSSEASSFEIDFTDTSESFALRKPWEVEEKDSNVTGGAAYQELRNNNGYMKTIEAYYKGEKASLRPSDFYIEIEDVSGNSIYSDNELDISRNGDEYGIYLSPLPSLDIGEYSFEIGIDRNENYKISEFSVYNYILFEGKIEDSRGQVQDADFRMTRDNEPDNIFSTEDGRYAESVLPGKYNKTIEFHDGIIFNFVDMEFVEEGDRSLMYDRIPRSNLEEIEGIQPVKAASILYGYGFESGFATIEYDHGDVTAENARVLKCEDWTMDRTCHGEWERISNENVSVDATVPEVSFPVKSQRYEDNEYLMAAYALVKNADLVPEMNVGTDRVPLGESVQMEGSVDSSSGGAVENVEVVIQVIEDEEVVTESSTETNSNGVFGVDVKAPEEEGIYDLRVSAEKEPYNGFEEEFTGVIETYVERELSISGPEHVDFLVGELTEIEYSIINTGQASMNDVRFRVKGVDNRWYNLSREEWDVLEPGESTRSTLSVEVPEDYFDQENMENTNFDVEIRGLSDGSEYNEIETSVATITNEHMYGSSSSQETEDDGASYSTPEMPTGEFLASQSSLNVALSLIMIFTMVLAGAIKKKKDGESSSRRSDRMSGRDGGRPGTNGGGSMNKPAVKPQQKQESSEESSEETDSEEKASEDDLAEENKEDSSDIDKAGFKCSVCGEEFDTESGRNLHKQALH